MGNKVSSKKVATIPFISDQISQIFDALAHSVIVNDGVEAAGLFDRFDHVLSSVMSLSI